MAPAISRMRIDPASAVINCAVVTTPYTIASRPPRITNQSPFIAAPQLPTADFDDEP